MSSSPMLLTLLLALALTSCSDGTSSGDASAGAPCVPSLQKEMCADKTDTGGERLRCDADKSTWTAISVCAVDAACQEVPDPAAPTGGRKVTFCGAPTPVSADGNDGGAGGGGEVAPSPDQASVRVKIEGVEVTNYTMPSPWVSGVASFDAGVELWNHSPANAVLNSVGWSTDNAGLSLIWSEGQPPWPLILTPGDVLHFDIRLTTNLLSDSQAKGTVQLDWQGGVAAPKKLTITPPDGTGKACAHTLAHTTRFASKSASQGTCVFVGNCGDAPLGFVSAQLDQQGTVYSLSSVPTPGTKVPALGHPKNPKAAPKGFSVCLSAQANKLGLVHVDDGDATLTVSTDAGEPLKFKLQAEVLTLPSMKIDCGGPNHGHLFDFPDGPSHTCSVTALADLQVTIDEATIQAWPGTNGTVVAAQYQLKVSLEKKGGEAVQATLPVALAKDDKLLLEVTRAAVAKGQPGAKLHLGWTGHGASSVQYMPIHSGTCDVPVLVHAPADPAFYLVSQPGGATVAAKPPFFLHNPTCAPVRINQMCSSNNSGTSQTTMCAGGKQSTFFQQQPVVYKGEVAPGALFSPSYTLLPHADPAKPTQQWWATQWCLGSSAKPECQSAAIKTNFPVRARVAELPTLTVPAVGVLGAAIAGRPMILVAHVQQQAWPQVAHRGWVWYVGYQAKGVTTWLYEDQQFTDEPWVRFIPDRPGKLIVYMAYRVKDPVTNVEHWSAVRSWQAVVQK